MPAAPRWERCVEAAESGGFLLVGEPRELGVLVGSIVRSERFAGQQQGSSPGGRRSDTQLLHEHPPVERIILAFWGKKKTVWVEVWVGDAKNCNKFLVRSVHSFFPDRARDTRITIDRALHDDAQNCRNPTFIQQQI